MQTTVRKEIEALRQMTLSQLRQKHAEVFGEETRSHHKHFLFRRIAWRIQALAEGDLSERARRRALEIANDARTHEQSGVRTRVRCDERLGGLLKYYARAA